MSTYNQTPGTLTLKMNQGDDFSSLVDFSISLVGYTVTSNITSLVTGNQVVPFTVSVVSSTAGQVNVSLSDTQTAALARGTYGWELAWTEGSVTRTALSGYVEVL